MCEGVLNTSLGDNESIIYANSIINLLVWKYNKGNENKVSVLGIFQVNKYFLL